MPAPIRVLLVEDSPDDAELMVLALTRGGFGPSWERVETAGAMRAALAGGRWDVILADNTLPGFGAVEALRLAREHDPDVPFVVISGTIGEEQAVAMMRAGASDYLLKGSLARLPAAVERELRESGNRRARRAAEQLSQDVLDSLSARVAILDADGTVVGVNAAWQRFAEANGGVGVPGCGLGANYLDVCSRAADPGGEANDVAEGIRRVLRGETRSFSLEFPCPSPPDQRCWFLLNATPLRTAGRGAVLSYTDVSERKRAALEALAREARFRALVEKSYDGLVLLDPEDVVLSASPSAGRIGGRPPEDYVGRKFHEFKHPDEAPGHLAGLRELAREPGGHRTEAGRFLHADGSWRWVEATFTNLLGEAAVRAVVVNFRDVTDRVRAEEGLRQARAEAEGVAARLRAVFSSMTEGVMIADATGDFLEWNEAALRVHGYDHAGEVRPSLAWLIEAWELSPPGGPPLASSERPMVRVLRGEKFSDLELQARSKDGGRVKTIRYGGAPVVGPDGRVEGGVLTLHDVTERRQAEETLRLRDRAIQAVSQGIVITDPNQPDNPVLYASPGFLALTGYLVGEVLGRNFSFLECEETDPDAVAGLRQACRQGLSRTLEVCYGKKDGTTFWAEASLSPVRDDGGRLIQFVGILTDVTQRRSQEEQYRQSQKIEAIGRLAGGVAHDFNNLLTVINGYGELLLEGMAADDPKRALVEDVCRAGERSAALTRQLLVFSRRQVVTPKVLDPNAVVADAERLLGRVLGEDVRLRTALKPLTRRVKADAGQLEQVLLNLAVNARDAMPRGGQLTIETADVELGEEYAGLHANVRPGAYVLLAVSDTGCGMTPEVKARIFEPFFTTKGPGKGTGLGLSVVHGIVQEAGGHVGVYSVPGAGTTFKVYLPGVEEAGRSGKPPSAVRPAPRGSETLLLVEDEAAVRALTRHVLAGCGYSILEAGDGEEALRVAARHGGPIHLLLTDVVMPGTGGRYLAERLLARRPGTKVLYVSGYPDDAVVRHGVLEEQVPFLQKPFSPLGLALKVREVLDSRAIPH